MSRFKPFKHNLSKMWATSPNLKEFIQAISAELEKIIERHKNQKIIIVAHGGTIDAILTHYFPMEGEWERGVIRNCSLTRIAINESKAKLLDFNDCSHLQ